MNLVKEIDLMHRHIAQKRPPLDRTVALLQQNGFNISDLEHDQFNYTFSNGTAMLNHYFIRMAFMDSWINILPPDKMEPIFESVETRLNEQARQAGGFKLSIPFVLINAVKK
jgi:hypothetical protein